MSLYTVIALAFFGVAALAFFLMYLLFPSKTILEERLEGLDEARKSDMLGVKKAASPWEKFLEMVGGQVPLRPEDYGQYRKILVSAGIREEMLPVFIGSKMVAAAILPVAYFTLGFHVKGALILGIATALALAVAGFLVPSIWLSKKVRKRQLRIFLDLPDVLDLMTVCVEAGLSMEGAMVRISEDREYAGSPLGVEMTRAIRETRAGKLRRDALRDMGARANEDDLKAFAAMLIQTEQLGTSLADSLRVHSDSLRTKRRQYAEEQAAKTAVKLLFPLVFFLMPPLLAIILLPALIRMGKFFAEM